MASRIRNPFAYTPRHRADRRASTVPHPLDFTLRHCANQGTQDGCMHRHPGEPLLPVWPVDRAVGS